MKKFLGFTLAEVMIVLVVIGIISAIIMPIAIQSVPDKNIMLFKKGHNTLYQVISTLANDGTYYKPGDLGVKADGTVIDGKHSSDNTYLCSTFADFVTTKKVDCKDVLGGKSWFGAFSYLMEVSEENGDSLQNAQKNADSQCKKAQETVGEEIVTTDGIIYYDANPKAPFKIESCNYKTIQEITNGCDQNVLYYFEHREKGGVKTKENGELLYIYKTFCMDVDGIQKGEDPFGYGIRIDGKVFAGARAQQWLDKEMTGQ